MNILLATTTAFLISFSVTPIIIRIFHSIDFLDNPNIRKIHLMSTPSMGGIAIFVSFVVTIGFWIPLAELANYKFVFLAIFFSFLLGVRDDISDLQALDKLTIQVFSSLLVVFVADIKFSELHGILGLHAIPNGVPEFISIFTIVAITNAFNLIDGIDGLASSISLIVLGFFSFWFFHTGQPTLSFIAASMGASVLGFLFFNWAPSKIFMGDTGSMLLGFTLSVLLIIFIELNKAVPLMQPWKIQAPVAIALALLVLPIYDTLRVFIIRWAAGRSPMSADKNHIHHVLLKLNLSHSQATLVMICFNISMVVLAWFLQILSNNWLCFIILLITTLSGGLLDYLLWRQTNQIKKEESVSTFIT